MNVVSPSVSVIDTLVGPSTVCSNFDVVCLSLKLSPRSTCISMLQMRLGAHVRDRDDGRIEIDGKFTCDNILAAVKNF